MVTVFAQRKTLRALHRNHYCGRLWIYLCGDGFMDFIHRPKSKILKIKITTFRKLALLPKRRDFNF
jgi:hypothetical protein